MSKDKTWSGRFNEPVSELVKKYTGSIDFDKRLAEWDIQGSLAHAQMLEKWLQQVMECLQCIQMK